MRITTRQLGVMRYLKEKGETNAHDIVKNSDLFRNIHYPRCVKDLHHLKKHNLVNVRRTMVKGNRTKVRVIWWSLTDRGIETLDSHNGKEIDPQPKLRELLLAVNKLDQLAYCYNLCKEIYGDSTGAHISAMRERLRIRVREGLLKEYEARDKIHYQLTDAGRERLERYQL